MGFLDAIPWGILDRDYGCGDPSAYLQPGGTVLDLGSGGGKICYIASQVVGPEGRVIGVDFNDEMLALARSCQPRVASAIGYDNVQFHKGKIQNLSLSYDRLEQCLRDGPVKTLSQLEALDEWKRRERVEHSMIATASVDVVVSNCVLNLVDPSDKEALFREMHRVLKRGGRAVISDIVCDEDIPQHLRDDPELWSGCISEAFREDRFLQAFAQAGFFGFELLKRDKKAWQTIEGIEFRAVTVRAYKGKEGPCLERLQAVIYKGPFSSVTDDDGHRLVRGQRMAVCDKTFKIYGSPPYRDHFELLPPHQEVPLEQAGAFACSKDAVRPPARDESERDGL